MDNSIILPENLTIPSKYCILMYNILNVVSQRGAIKADEFKVVGDLFEFLKEELQINKQIEKTNKLSPVQEE
tara:strand:- start:1019 stop:1234 length:216 start_codon:yes stop_codon:yes gene_type:complete